MDTELGRANDGGESSVGSRGRRTRSENPGANPKRAHSLSFGVDDDDFDSGKYCRQRDGEEEILEVELSESSDVDDCDTASEQDQDERGKAGREDSSRGADFAHGTCSSTSAANNAMDVANSRHPSTSSTSLPGRRPVMIGASSPNLDTHGIGERCGAMPPSTVRENRMGDVTTANQEVAATSPGSSTDVIDLSLESP